MEYDETTRRGWEWGWVWAPLSEGRRALLKAFADIRRRQWTPYWQELEGAFGQPEITEDERG